MSLESARNEVLEAWDGPIHWPTVIASCGAAPLTPSEAEVPEHAALNDASELVPVVGLEECGPVEADITVGALGERAVEGASVPWERATRPAISSSLLSCV